VKWNRIRKLQSGALQFTVFIGVLIALLLSGLMLYAYTFLYCKEQSKATIENIQLSNSGINYLLTQNEIVADTVVLPIELNQNYTVKANLSYWGIFQKGFVSTQHRKKTFEKVAFIGSSIVADESPTLYLLETYNPLTLVGATKIKGIAYLPSQGVKSGYIAGQSFYGTQLIDGIIKKSELTFPNFSKDYHDQLLFYTERYKPSQQRDFIDLQTNQKIVNSFKSSTRGVYSRAVIILENNRISGNIIIKSDTLIQVKNRTQLKDVILIAPRVEIEEGTQGNFQVIATKTITVGKNCTLNYPSALVLFQDNKNQTTTTSKPLDNQIFIDSDSSVKGSVCYFQTKAFANDFNTQIVLQEKATVKGQVYCDGSFELKGTVFGSVYTKQFIANQAGSIFVNHIYNGVIKNENIPAIFGGLIFEKNPKIVMSWLY
jgi:hypothetical protein